MEEEHKLTADSLGVGKSIVMGVAGAAPAFSVAAVTTTLIASVGTLAPASIIYCGLIMFGISLAFIHLNKVIVNAGASYAWVSEIFGFYLGFFTGWAVLVSSAVFMVSGSIPAATATLLLIAPDLVQSPGWIALVSILWISAIALIAIRGVKTTATLQMLMTGFEILILIGLISLGTMKYIHTPMHAFSLSSLSLTHFTPDLFAAGSISAIFLYWGWDVTLNLNEETKNTQHIPGVGAFWSIVLLILIFISFTIVCLLVLSDEELQKAGTNVIFAVADKLVPRPWSYLAVLAVMLSSIGTLQTTIVQFTRTLFAEARDKVLPVQYAKLHHLWKTPWLAIITIWFFGTIFLLLSSTYPTVNLIIKDSVHAIGFFIAFYYSITGLACAWYYRSMWNNLYELIAYIIWPVSSAAFLMFIVSMCLPTFDTIARIITIGGILSGFIPLWFYLRKKK